MAEGSALRFPRPCDSYATSSVYRPIIQETSFCLNSFRLGPALAISRLIARILPPNALGSLTPPSPRIWGETDANQGSRCTLHGIAHPMPVPVESPFSGIRFSRARKAFHLPSPLPSGISPAVPPLSQPR